MSLEALYLLTMLLGIALTVWGADAEVTEKLTKESDDDRG